jgi:hypothetical protein
VRPIDGDAVMAILDAYELTLNSVRDECSKKDTEGADLFKKIAQVQKIQIDYFRSAISQLPTINTKQELDPLYCVKSTILN